MLLTSRKYTYAGQDLITKMETGNPIQTSILSNKSHLMSKTHSKIITNKNIDAESNSTNKRLLSDLLNKYVLENAGVFETDGELLYCKVCKKSVSYDTKFSVNQHLKTQKHINYFAQIHGKPNNDTITNKQLAESKQISSIWENKEDMCRTCMMQFSKAKHKINSQNITEIPKGSKINKSIMELLKIIQPSIIVDIKDNLPIFVCSDCIRKLLVTYEFMEMYQNVDKKLRKMLEDIDMNNCNNNSDELKPILDEIEVPVDFETNKYEIEIEQINIESLVKEQSEKGINWPEFKDEPIEELAEIVENNEIDFLNPYSDFSDEDWLTDKNSLNVSEKEHIPDDVTKRVFKGFFQPEKNDDGTLTCQLCEKVLNGVMHWRAHIRQQHLEEKPKRAYNRSKPREKSTQKIQNRIPPNKDGLYQCEYCEKSFPKYLFYRRHLRKHTEEPHLCIECGKSFSLLGSYNSHMLRHKGEKTYQCPHCPKSFVCSSGLYNHAITHNNNKPYVCDTCGSAFHMAYQLKKHNRIHTGVKKYQCEYCDMRFITGEKQRRHMRTHTGEKPYRCKYCERAFAQSNDCVKHLRQHLGDNVYQCDLCPERYPLLRELRVHFASHKDDDEETRARNLQARTEAEKNLQIKLGFKESV